VSTADLRTTAWRRSSGGAASWAATLRHGAAAAVLLAACSGAEPGLDRGAGPAADPAAAPIDDPPAGHAVPARDAAAGVPVCLQGQPFVATGSIGVRDAQRGDASRVAGLRAERHDGCDRFVIDLVGEDGRAASRAGRVTAELLRELGVVRVSLRDVTTVDPDATDASLGGALARDAFAVFSPDGRFVFVDVHLGEPAEAFITTLDDPARVVVDLRPGGGAVPAAAPREQRVVVLRPRPGAASYPLTVAGYARTFEANVVVRLEHDGREAFRDFTTATAWADAWGHYSLTIPDGPTAGTVILHVGEYSARDGTWQGAAVRLQLR
jgi:hypothetical protein